MMVFTTVTPIPAVVTCDNVYLAACLLNQKFAELGIRAITHRDLIPYPVDHRYARILISGKEEMI